jgi:hypothetical protein
MPGPERKGNYGVCINEVIMFMKLITSIFDMAEGLRLVQVDIYQNSLSQNSRQTCHIDASWTGLWAAIP